MTQWRSIASAPRDTEFDGWGYTLPDSGEDILNPEFRRMVHCYWGDRDSDYLRPREGWCVRGHDGWSWAAVLTHWMPEPEAPTI